LDLDPISTEFNGINIKSTDILGRHDLIKRLADLLRTNKMVYLGSSAASGKTSLMALFAKAYPSVKCIHLQMSFPRFDGSPVPSASTMLLKKTGIELGANVIHRTEIFDLNNPLQEFVIMLDDAHGQFHDNTFWEALIKDFLANYLPPNVRFLVSATYGLGTQWSPASFNSVVGLRREDLMISRAEAFELLSSVNYLNWQDPLVKEVIINQCQGLIGGIAVSACLVNAHFKNQIPTLSSVLDYCLSLGVNGHDLYRRCFSNRLSTLPIELRSVLVLCLTEGSHAAPTNPDESYLTLIKAGILTQSDSGLTVEFSSPLAMKYVSNLLFPNRLAGRLPSDITVFRLVEDAIKFMSASALLNSKVSSTDFPHEATFQHLFMNGIMRVTPNNCFVCPELSKHFPSQTVPSTAQVDGRIDFYINSSLRYGIELLVQGNGIGEHLALFETNGKYQGLAVNDYAVVDFRGNTSGEITGVVLHPKRITVFFRLDDYTKCNAVFGYDESKVIQLQA